MNDIRFAIRMLLKYRGFTALVILTLALGIGSNTAIFSAVNATFLRPLPYPNADRLLYISERNQNGEMSVSYPNYLDFRTQQTAFASVAIFSVEDEKLKISDASEQVSTALVSHEFLTVLGVTPSQGRGILPSDNQLGSAPVVWLTDRVWKKFFAADPSLVGNPVVLDGQSMVVAGILPANFRFIREIDFLRTIGPLVDHRFMNMRINHNGTFVIGRLRDNITLDAARSQFDAIYTRLQKEYPKDNSGITIKALPFRERIAGWARSQLFLLLGAVALVLLIACVNVANMLLARSVSREREMAIRTALGATRPALIRQLLAESIILALAGGLLGTLLAWWGCISADRLVPWEMRILASAPISIDLRVLVFTAALTLLAGVTFGLAPAWRLSHARPYDALKDTPRPVIGRFRLSDVLVAAQVSIALMLLVGAGLLARSLSHLTRVSPGFQPEHILTMRITPPPLSLFKSDPFASFRFHENLLRSVRNTPEVESVAFGSTVPFTWNASTWMFFLEDAPIPAPGQFPSAYCHTVVGDYFSAMQIPVLRGRVFDGKEPQPSLIPGLEFGPETLNKHFGNTPLYSVINQRLAEKHWPGQNPIGKRFTVGSPEMHIPWIEVIGVVGNTTPEGLDHEVVPEIYVSMRQLPFPTPLHLIVRAHGDPSQAIPSVRDAIRAGGCHDPIFDIKTMPTRLDDNTSDRRFSANLYGFFAAVALFLSGIGIYGVLAFTVSQRTREVGIRMALGSQRSHVLTSILKRGLALILPGVLIGLAGAWAIAKLLQNQLYGVTSLDPLTYLVAAASVLATAIAACWIPARRAASVDPIVALRYE